MKMRKMMLCMLTLAASATSFAQGEFQSPWRDATRALIIDPYQDNDIVWEKLVTDKHVVVIIHQATKGDHGDKKYVSRRDKAKALGYKWGSYHLGLPGDPIIQAKFYLATAQPAADEVMALDIEKLDPEVSMSLPNAKRFIKAALALRRSKALGSAHR